MSLRLVFFNDPHFSRHPPECRSEEYPHEILDKIHEVIRIAVKLKAVGIGCSGDWFHRKGKVTFREANDVLAVLRAALDKGLLPFGILGNHDIAGHSLDSLDGRAVGALVHSRVLHLLDHAPLHIQSPGSVVTGRAIITGTSYFHGCDSNDDNRLRMYGTPLADTGKYQPVEIPEDTVHIHVAHGTLKQKGEFFEDYTVAPELIELLHEHDRLPDVIVCGHLHFSEGIKLHEAPDGRSIAVCRVGSLGRVARDDLDRQVHALVIAIKGRGYVCKAVPIGKKPLRGMIHAGTGSTTTEETEERIQEFVRVLREEADAWSLVDHGTLLAKVAKEMGHDEETLRIAREAVERRQ